MAMEGAERRINSLYRHLALSRNDPSPLHRVLLDSGMLNNRNNHKYKAEAAVVIGGMVLDIHAIPYSSVVPRTTIPGKICYYHGGVGRNIAECMSKLGVKPFMISAVGRDIAGDTLLQQWNSAGLPVEGIHQQENIRTAVVCNLIDATGEVAAGVASVESIENFLTVEWIQQFQYHVDSAIILMIDANLSHPALEASCQMSAKSGVPVWFEPVSITKSKRVASVAKYVTYTSPNEDELIAMAEALSPGNSFGSVLKYKSKGNISLEALFQMLKPAIWVLLEQGIKVVVVTLGPQGVLLCSQGGPRFVTSCLGKTGPSGFGEHLFHRIASACPREMYSSTTVKISDLFALHLSALPASVKKLTGAGDCLVGATLASLCAGLNMVQATAVGIAVARATVEAEENVPSSFNLNKIAEDARSVYLAAKILSSEAS